MKVLGLIVEYNPFHTGHLYHINKAKQMIKPDYTIAIMSGNFVQRGEVAIIDKFKRSELAIKYGVDLVIELPFYYVNQSADYFCKGAIDILNKLGCSDIVFGSESNDINSFKEIAYQIKNNKDKYNKLVKEAMSEGKRYPDACNQALSILLNKSITTPNDLLGLGYVKEIIFNDYNINIHTISRTNDYHGTTLGSIASATSLRLALRNNEDVSKYLLDMSYYDHIYNQNDFFNYLKYQIIITNKDNLKKIHLVDEGIENLLKKVIYNCNNYDELINKLTSKRYTNSRIKRMLLNILMNNTSKEIKNCYPIDYIHILKMNNKGQQYLNIIKKKCKYNLITNLSSYKHPALDLELKASKLLSLIDDEILDKEFKNIPIK